MRFKHALISALAVVCLMAASASAQMPSGGSALEIFFGGGGAQKTGHANPSFMAGARLDSAIAPRLRVVGQAQIATAKKEYIGDGWQWGASTFAELDVLRFENASIYGGMGFYLSEGVTSQYKKWGWGLAYKGGARIASKKGLADLSYTYKATDHTPNAQTSHNFTLRYDFPKTIKGMRPGIQLAAFAASFNQEPFAERQRSAGGWLKARLSKSF